MKIGGLVENGDLTMYRITSIEDRPGAAAEILKLFAEEKVRLQYITESSAPEDTAVMTLCVNAKEGQRIDHLFEMNDQLIKQIKISRVADVSVIGIYGPHFKEKPVLPAKFCKILGKADINILAISSSISSISCVIHSDCIKKAKKALLKEFQLP
jgi:aspartokinase